MPHRGALTPFEPELNDKPRGPRRALGAVTGRRQSGGSHGQRGGHGRSLTTIVGGAILDLGPVGALGLHASAQTWAALTVGFRHVTTKHLSDWSFDECEREVRGSLLHRAFCRIDGERVPDAKTLIRLAQLLGRTRAQGRTRPPGGPGARAARRPRPAASGSTPPSPKPTFIPPRMPRSWPMRSGCSRAACDGSGSGSASARAAWRTGSSRSLSAVGPPAIGCRGVRTARQDPGGRGSIHHRLRGV